MNEEHIKTTAKTILKTIKLLKMARNKRETVRNSEFYGVFGDTDEQIRKIRFMDAVVERLENRVKRLTKTINE